MKAARISRGLASGHEAGHAVVAWHYRLYLHEVRLGELVTPDGTHAGGWVHVPLPDGRPRAVGAFLLAGYAANVMQGIDDDEAWGHAQGDYAVLARTGANMSPRAIQRHCDDACRILDRRWRQWERLAGHLAEAGVLSWREVAAIASRRDPYS